VLSIGLNKNTLKITQSCLTIYKNFQEKTYWRRYIYLWINYALFEELEMEDEERTRQVYRACLQLLPHKIFTFSKIWLYYANFELRNKNLPLARKYLVSTIPA
jgi:crooked neck